jgi:hypothetical protein
VILSVGLVVALLMTGVAVVAVVVAGVVSDVLTRASATDRVRARPRR